MLAGTYIEPLIKWNLMSSIVRKCSPRVYNSNVSLISLMTHFTKLDSLFTVSLNPAGENFARQVMMLSNAGLTGASQFTVLHHHLLSTQHLYHQVKTVSSIHFVSYGSIGLLSTWQEHHETEYLLMVSVCMAKWLSQQLQQFGGQAWFSFTVTERETKQVITVDKDVVHMYPVEL